MEVKAARRLLEEERRRLEDIKDTFGLTDLQFETEQESVDELSSVDQHVADLATETFEREKRVSVLASVEDQLRDVERAFRRLENGRYGFCEVCGRQIPDERLEARPAARYCIEHQQGVEEA